MARILVVEDSAVVRRMLGLILQRAGHQVSFAADGEQGLSEAARLGLDLLITDLEMPALDGISQQKLAGAPATLAGSQLEGVILHQETLRRTRLELEFELARSVQSELNSATPSGIRALDIHAESRAASAVGGNFYDFTARRDGSLVRPPAYGTQQAKSCSTGRGV